MANVLTGDSALKALWLFAPGALTADSIGTNTLVPYNGTPVAGVAIQGCASVSLGGACYYILDANLQSGFPFKNGDTTKLLTLAFKFRPPASISEGGLIGKLDFEANANAWGANIWGDGRLIFDTGNTYRAIANAAGSVYFTASHEYQIIYSIDGVNGILRMYIYDYTAGAYLTSIDGCSIGVAPSTLQFLIGLDSGRNNYLHGEIAEVAVFNRILGYLERETIRKNAFPLAVDNNNFPSDSACKAYWQGASLTDSLNSNVLATLQGSPVIDNFAAMNGASGLDLMGAALGGGSLKIADASLASGFPCKTGDSVKKCSFNIRMVWPGNITSVTMGPLISKGYFTGGGNFQGWALVITNGSQGSGDVAGQLQFAWAKNNSAVEGTGTWGYQTGLVLTPGIPYSIGVAFDGVNKTLLVSVTNLLTQAQTTYSVSPPDALYYPASGWADFCLADIAGGWGHLPACFLMGEVAVWNRVLSATELAEVAAGTFIITPVLSVADAGAGVDAVLAGKALALADSGTGVDAPLAGEGHIEADSGTGSDAILAGLGLIITDVGASIDATLIGKVLALADSGLGVDASLVGKTLVVTDSGVGAEVLLRGEVIALADAGGAADLIFAGKDLYLAETGTGADQVSVVHLVSVILLDAGAGVDAVLAGKALALADTGVGTDTSSGDKAILFGYDEYGNPTPGNQLGIGTDAILAGLGLKITDVGAGVDATLIGKVLALEDSGLGVDASLVGKTLVVTETGAGSEVLLRGEVIGLVESGVGAEGALINKGIRQTTNFYQEVTGRYYINLFFYPVVPGSFSVQLETPSGTVTDDGNGNLSDGGTINYITGQCRFTISHRVGYVTYRADYTAGEVLQDSGAGADQVTVVHLVSVILSDAGAGAEVILAGKMIALAESASGADLALRGTQVVILDTSVGVDMALAGKALRAIESGIGAELLLDKAESILEAANGRDFVKVKDITYHPPVAIGSDEWVLEQVALAAGRLQGRKLSYDTGILSPLKKKAADILRGIR